MEILTATTNKNNRAKNAKRYIVLYSQKIGNKMMNVYSRNSKEYVRHNGKYMQLTKYKDLLKAKGLYKSPTKLIEKNCKRDCKLIEKICNKKTGRCNKIKVPKICKEGKERYPLTGRCRKIKPSI